MHQRLHEPITEDMLRSTQSKRLVAPRNEGNSSQRLDMFQSHCNTMVVPLVVELPNFQSSMEQDIITKSTVIKKARGKITLLHKFKYQFRTIYIYKLNGIYDVYDTDGIFTTNQFSVPVFTDLSSLELNTEYDIDDEDENFCIRYPKQYDPVSQTLAYGNNITTIISTNMHNSADSVCVSESFMRKFTAIKTKTPSFILANKVVKSAHPNLFPPLGQIVKESILFKICTDEGVITDLVQNPDIPSGYEDDVIVMDANSYLTSIEVYNNTPIENNPILEEYRVSLLEFRKSVYDAIAPLVNGFPDKCSNMLKIMKDNFGYNKFSMNGQEIKNPYVRLKINTIDMPTVGAKFSNFHGAKVTVQHVYPDGELVDEFGRNIECEFPTTAILGRSIFNLIVEHHLTSISLHIKYLVENDLISPQDIYNFISEMCSILYIERGWKSANYTVDELWSYLKEETFRIIVPPYDTKIDMDVLGRLYKLAKTKLGFRKSRIFRGTNPKNRLQLTSDHVVGTLFIFRDMHDCKYGNSSCSVVERNTKGFAVEKDSAKRDGRALYTKKCCKQDVQFIHLLLNMASNETAYLTINDSDESLYGIQETMQASGMELVFQSVIDEGILED